MVIFYLTFISVILTTFLILILFNLNKLFKLLQSKHNLTADVPAVPTLPDLSQLTSYEIERLEREESFDERIKQLKEEVYKQSEVIRRGTLADELHPLVHNLPHDILQTKYDLPSYEEVAE